MSPLGEFSTTANRLAASVRSKEIAVSEVADFYIKRTESLADELNCNLFFSTDQIAKEVKRVESLIKDNSSPLPLAGVPVAIKDNICTKGIPTTCGSKILENYIAPYDATVIKKLKNAGALIFSKTNLDEFAMGSSNENSAFGVVKNPWKNTHVPGGSSGGSAAAVAADLIPVALGSDTGGSVRQPASFCGIVGLKPTYGRVSRFGLTAYGSSLDQIGPLTRSVKDCALLLDVISGHDPKDSTSLNERPTETLSQLGSKEHRPIKKIGVIKELFEEGLSDEVRKCLDQAIACFKENGIEIVEVSIPELHYAIAVYYVIATAEASSNLSRFDGVRYGYRANDIKNLTELYEKSRSEAFGKEVIQRIMLGTFVLSAGYSDAFYGKATRIREMISNGFDKALSKVDLLLSPTAPTTAFKIGEKVDDPLSMYLSDICTIAANLIGLPAISMPAGFDQKGLPVGLQLMAPKKQESQLLRGAYLYEHATSWLSDYRPELG